MDKQQRKELKNKYVTVWLEGNILMGIYENVDIDLPIAKEIVKERIAFFGKEDRLAMVELGATTSFTKEARDYMGTAAAAIGITKLALIATSPISYTLGHFYLKINRPPILSKIFSDKKAAIKWLLKP